MTMFNKNQKYLAMAWRSKAPGMTLIELVMALLVAFIIAGAAYSVLAQLFNTNTRSTGHMVVVRQVQNAGFWVSRDGLMALQIYTTSNLTSPDKLRLRWTDWRNDGQPDVVHDVYYKLQNNQLLRYDVADGRTAVVASDITSANSTLVDNTIVFNITSVVGSESESRTYKVVPRTRLN
jgi:type II secretory pathway component PulJ